MVKVYPGNSLCGSFIPFFSAFPTASASRLIHEKQERRRGPGQQGRGGRGARAREIARPFLLLFSCLAILAAERVFTTVQRQRTEREALLSSHILLHIYIYKESSTHSGLELNIFLIQGILVICAGCRKNRKRNDGKKQGARPRTKNPSAIPSTAQEYE